MKHIDQARAARERKGTRMLIQKKNKSIDETAGRELRFCNRKFVYRTALILWFSLMFGLMPVAPQFAWGTVMEDVAAQMQPGEWVELNTNGFEGGAILRAIDHILAYSDEAIWDPISRQIFFYGATHGGTEEHRRFIKYVDSTNSWTVLPSPIPLSHAYDHQAFDPNTGIYYHRQHNSKTIYQYNRINGIWDVIPEFSGLYSVAGALEYFPEMGGLIFVDGNWGVRLFDLTSNQWSLIAHTNVGGSGNLPVLPMGSYHNFTEYNTVHRVLIFGGGNESTDLYKIDASGTIATLSDAPIILGITHTIVTSDPVSGKFLVFGKDASFYEYDVATDTWTLQTGTAPPFFVEGPGGPISGTIAAPISNYGVVMFVNYDYDQSKVYLYRHSSGSPSVPIIPATPTELQVN